MHSPFLIVDGTSTTTLNYQSWDTLTLPWHNWVAEPTCPYVPPRPSPTPSRSERVAQLRQSRANTLARCAKMRRANS